MKVLIIGAGITGCFTAARLMQKGVDISVLARGDKAVRLERDGLRMCDGITGEKETARLNIIRSPVVEQFDLVMVCLQAQHRRALDQLLRELPGRPIVWYLGNTTQGYDAAIEQLGRDRVLGGFPGVGGSWQGEVLVYADREKPGGKPFDRLIIGEAHPDAAEAAETVQNHFQKVSMNIERFVPIMAWHWTHVAMILPLAAAVYHHSQDLDAVAADRALLKRTMRATAQGLTAIRRTGYPILPRGLNIMRWIPAALGAGKIARLLKSDFGRIAIAGHAAKAREEIHSLATDFLALAGANAGTELRELFRTM